MKVNYVLMYGTPYLKYKEFEKFDDISKYLINKGICNYRIFEPMEDLKEMEMIHLENDVRVLEGKIKQLQSQLKAKEEVIKEAREYIKDNIEVYAFNNEDLPHWEFNDDNIKELDLILSKGENK